MATSQFVVIYSPTFLLLWFYSLTFLQGLPFLSLWQSAFSLFNLQGWLFFRFGQSAVPPLLLQGWLFLICSKMQWQYSHFFSCRSDYFTIYSMYHFSCRGGYFLVCDNLHLHLDTIASSISEEVQTFYGHHYHKSPPLYFQKNSYSCLVIFSQRTENVFSYLLLWHYTNTHYNVI